MSKQEKVILVIVFFVAVFGIYEVFLSSPSKTSSVDNGAELKGLNNLIAEVIQGVARENLSESETYIITKAEAEWSSDPFLEIIKPEKRPKAPKWADSSTQKASFTYTGYVELGDTKIAIINGREYKTGEELELGGCFIERIEASKVVVRGTGKKETIIVPIVEEVL